MLFYPSMAPDVVYKSMDGPNQSITTTYLIK